MSTEAIDRHYPDDELSALAATARVEEDAHLRSCRDCAEKLEAFQLIAEALHDGAVWDTAELRTEPVPSTVAALRAFADAMAEDDAYAEEVLPELLAGSRETWMPRLEQHPEWRGAGVVRKLIEAASRAIDTMPPDAVEMTALATNIAERLDDAEYDRDTIARLSGAAWRERAYALFYTGKYIDAEEAILASKRHFSECVASEYELARLSIVDASVLRSFERLQDADDAAAAAAKAFADYEDGQRAGSAGMLRAQLCFHRGDYAAAREILVNLELSFRHAPDAETHARVVSNLAYCCRSMGHIEQAIHYYELSSGLFDALGITTEATRNRWNGAVMLAEIGRTTEARERLTHVVAEFERLGMTSVAALAALDVAELHLASGQFDAVEQLCRRAMRSFENSGLAYSPRALTALSFIRDAAQQRTANRALVRKVREYIRELPSQPTLLFAYPPE